MVIVLASTTREARMPKAVYRGKTIAQSDDTVVVEGNHYFPPSALEPKFLEPSQHQTVCGWKGTASYYHVIVDGEMLENAAWYYRDPKSAALQIRGRVAFWKGVEVVD